MIKNTLRDFIDFIRTQGVVSVAVAFIIGKAVSDLVASVVTDLVNPIIGIALKNLGDLSALSFHVLSANITYGKFISVLINFVIVAFVVYFGVKIIGVHKLDKPKQ